MKAFCRTESSPFFAWPSTVRIALPLKFAAGTTQVGMVWLVPSGLSTMTAQLRHCAAAELGPGHPEILAQEIVHRQLVAHLARAVRASIDGDGQRRHLSTPLIMDCVTGKDRKR